MSTLRLRAVIALVFMLLALGGATAWTPRSHLADQRPKVDLEAMFPRSFGEWAIDDRMPVQLISPDTQALLNKIYNQTLSRTYVNQRGERIMLSVAYGGDQSDATRAHRPEVCYPAQGFQILANFQSKISVGARSLPVRHLVAKLGGRVEPITYWIVVGEKIALSGTEQKFAQLSYSLRGVIPDGMLVRISSIDAESQKAYAGHAAFVSEMAKAILPRALPGILGAAGT